MCTSVPAAPPPVETPPPIPVAPEMKDQKVAKRPSARLRANEMGVNAFRRDLTIPGGGGSGLNIPM